MGFLFEDARKGKKAANFQLSRLAHLHLAGEPPAEQCCDLDSGGFPQEPGSRSGCPQSRAAVGRRPDEGRAAARRPPSGQGQPPPPARGWTALLPQEPARLRTSCSFRQGCKRRRKKPFPKAGWSGQPPLYHLRRPFLVTLLLLSRAWLHLAWNFRTFPYLTLVRLALVPTQMASSVQIVDVSGWAFHGPIEQKAKLRTPVGPRAKGAIYCPQLRCLIPDLLTTERSPLPQRVHSAVRNPPPPPTPWRLPCLHGTQGQWCYLPALGVGDLGIHTASRRLRRP